jgi:hypothetical protein
LEQWVPDAPAQHAILEHNPRRLIMGADRRDGVVEQIGAPPVAVIGRGTE